MPVVPAIWEAKVRGLLVSRSQDQSKTNSWSNNFIAKELFFKLKFDPQNPCKPKLSIVVHTCKCQTAQRDTQTGQWSWWQHQKLLFSDLYTYTPACTDTYPRIPKKGTDFFCVQEARARVLKVVKIPIRNLPCRILSLIFFSNKIF